MKKEELTDEHWQVLRIMTIRSLRGKYTTPAKQAINKITFIMMKDKEYVRELLKDLKKAGMVNTKFLVNREDPLGVYKWYLTKKGVKEIKNQWEQFYETVKK